MLVGTLLMEQSLHSQGKWFNPIQYGVNESGLIDYDQVESLAKEHKPKLIIAGGSAYSRKN